MTRNSGEQVLVCIKIYKSQNELIHRAAIGVVWRRVNRTSYVVHQIMNFGRESATLEEIRKWIGIETNALGRLPPYTSGTHSRRTENPWLHNSAVTYTSPASRSRSNNRGVNLRIPDADMVDGVVDRAGQPVVAIPNLFLTIDFGRILSGSDWLPDTIKKYKWGLIVNEKF